MTDDIRTYKIDRITEFSDEVVNFVIQEVNQNASLSRLNWEYRTKQYPLLFFVLNDQEDRISGTQALIPIQGCYKGQLIETGKSECTFVGKQYRGTRAFKDLYEAFLKASDEQGLKLVWGLTSAVKIWKEKLAFDFAEMIIFHFDLPNSGNYIQWKRLSWLRHWRTKLTVKRSLRQLPLGDWTMTPIHQITPELVQWRAQVLEAMQTTFYIGTNEDYYKWRLQENPYHDYGIWKFMSGVVMKGLLITSKANGRVWIHEWIVQEEEDAVFQFNLIRRNLARYNDRIGYLGNRTHPMNQIIEKVFIDNKGTINVSDWAGLVAKSNIGSVDALDLKDALINLLWTEGV